MTNSQIKKTATKIAQKLDDVKMEERIGMCPANIPTSFKLELQEYISKNKGCLDES